MIILISKSNNSNKYLLQKLTWKTEFYLFFENNSSNEVKEPIFQNKQTSQINEKPFKILPLKMHIFYAFVRCNLKYKKGILFFCWNMSVEKSNDLNMYANN